MYLGNYPKMALGIYCRTSIIPRSGESTIAQQEEYGIRFAKEHKMDYTIYKDDGKSGYKVANDEENPFDNRPEFSRLLEDIRSGIITDVWVFETSRLSRKMEYFIKVLSDFEKKNAILWVVNERYKVTDPYQKAMLSMTGVFNELERQQIIARTQKGQKIAYNNGKRRYREMYGYDQKTTDTAKITTPNKPQLEIVKECFSRYLSGESLIQIGKDIFLDTMNNQLAASQKVKQIITHEEYTGQNLTVDGAEIEKEFSEGRLADLEELRKDLYWANSVYYTEKVIDRDSWIKAREKMEWNRRQHAKPQTGNKRETEKSLASGFLKCYGCGNRFYLKDLRQYKKSIFYYHLRPTVECKQKRNILAEKLDTIIDVFYTFYYLLLDNTDDQLRKMKLEIRAELKKTEKELNKLSSERNKKQKIIDNLETELASGNYESVSVIVKLIEKTTNEMAIIDEQLRLSNLALYETKRKDAELSRNEKYKASTIEKITKWFELREENNYSELRILFREILFENTLWIEGSIIKIIAGDPGRVFFFDTTNDYKIIYPFIEKLIGKSLNKTYSKIEQTWIDNHREKLENFSDRVNEFLLTRPNRKSEELFQNNDYLFLSDCFDNVSYGDLRLGDFGLDLFTNKEIYLNETSYVTTERAAEIIGKSYSTVRLWGFRNGVEAIRSEDGIKRLFWSEADIERYKNAIHKPSGFKGHKHSEETKKHFSEIRKGINHRVKKKS